MTKLFSNRRSSLKTLPVISSDGIHMRNSIGIVGFPDEEARTLLFHQLEDEGSDVAQVLFALEPNNKVLELIPFKIADDLEAHEVCAQKQHLSFELGRLYLHGLLVYQTPVT